MPGEVELIYFKESGKYYTEGSYQSRVEHAFEVYEEVALLREHGRLPGLSDGPHEDFTIYINPIGFKYAVPALNYGRNINQPEPSRYRSGILSGSAKDAVPSSPR